MKRAILLFLLVSLPALAQADDARPRYAVSVPVLSLLAGGLNLQGERYLESKVWSFAVSTGLRSSTAGDYGALRLSLGAEARVWWHRGPWSTSEDGALGGGFVYGRVDLAWNRLEQAGRGFIGSGLQTSESMGLGYRFLPVWKLEISPLLGLELTQVNARYWLSQMRLTTRWGLTVGLIL